jgi:hypothetical protein
VGRRLAKLCKGSSGVWGSETAEALDRLETQCVRVVQDMVGQGVPPAARASRRLPLEAPSARRDGISLELCSLTLAARRRGAQVANALWSLATLGRAPSSELLAALAARFRALERDLLPQNISNFLWALGTSPPPPPADELEQRLASYAVWRFLTRGARGQRRSRCRRPTRRQSPSASAPPYASPRSSRRRRWPTSSGPSRPSEQLSTGTCPLAPAFLRLCPCSNRAAGPKGGELSLSARRRALADALGRNAERLSSSLTPQNIANILWVRSLLSNAQAQGLARSEPWQSGCWAHQPGALARVCLAIS